MPACRRPSMGVGTSTHQHISLPLLTPDLRVHPRLLCVKQSQEVEAAEATFDCAESCGVRASFARPDENGGCQFVCTVAERPDCRPIRQRRRRWLRFTFTSASACSALRVRRRFDFISCPQCGQTASAYVPFPCCNSSSAGISPINSRRRSAALPAISSSVGCGCPSPNAHISSNISSGPAHKFCLRLFPFHCASPLLYSSQFPSLPPFIHTKIWDALLQGKRPSALSKWAALFAPAQHDFRASQSLCVRSI